MRDDREQWLQQRAYEIWEAEGWPSGRDRAHWEQAELEFATTDSAPSFIASTIPATAKKPRRGTAAKAPASTPRAGKKKAAELSP